MKKILFSFAVFVSIAAVGLSLDASAGPLDDLAKGIGQSVTDAVKTGVGSAFSGINPPPAAPENSPAAPPPQPPVKPAQASKAQSSAQTSKPQTSAAGASGLPRSTPSNTPTASNTSADAGSFAALPAECFTSRMLSSTMLEVSNRCDNNYMILYRLPGKDTCNGTSILRRSNEKILLSRTFVTACLAPRGARAVDSCTCPEGAAYTTVPRSTAPVNGFPTDSDGCPVEKNDPRWATIQNGQRCSR